MHAGERGTFKRADHFQHAKAERNPQLLTGQRVTAMGLGSSILPSRCQATC